MERTILHSDLNNFYASVECLYNPALREVPMAVVGDAQARHGIVLAKNNLAKACGVQTGEALWQARQKCPDITFVPARFSRYLDYSQRVRSLYTRYTDQVEPFGLDECWLDVTGSARLFGSGPRIADQIRADVRALGLTVSVGVSFNKVFAKLGSDLKKPDATTVITSEGYRRQIWRLPVENLLYVGPATRRKLANYGIRTIGALAQTDPDFLRRILGKNGVMLWHFANGRDASRVAGYQSVPVVKSVGNSTTAPRDLTCDQDVRITLYALCESVAARLREQGCRCQSAVLGVRDTRLVWYERQTRLPRPTMNSAELFDALYALFAAHHPPGVPVRSMSVRAAALRPADAMVQLSLFDEDARSQKRDDLERAVDAIRSRYGYHSVQRALMLTDPALNLDAKRDHIIHPVGFLGTLS